MPKQPYTILFLILLAAITFGCESNNSTETHTSDTDKPNALPVNDSVTIVIQEILGFEKMAAYPVVITSPSKMETEMIDERMEVHISGKENGYFMLTGLPIFDGYNFKIHESGSHAVYDDQDLTPKYISGSNSPLFFNLGFRGVEFKSKSSGPARIYMFELDDGRFSVAIDKYFHRANVYENFILEGLE